MDTMEDMEDTMADTVAITEATEATMDMESGMLTLMASAVLSQDTTATMATMADTMEGITEATMVTESAVL